MGFLLHNELVDGLEEKYLEEEEKTWEVDLVEHFIGDVSEQK